MYSNLLYEICVKTFLDLHYWMSEKSWPVLHSNLQYKLDEDFLDNDIVKPRSPILSLYTNDIKLTRLLGLTVNNYSIEKYLIYLKLRHWWQSPLFVSVPCTKIFKTLFIYVLSVHCTLQREAVRLYCTSSPDRKENEPKYINWIFINLSVCIKSLNPFYIVTIHK